MRRRGGILRAGAGVAVAAMAATAPLPVHGASSAGTAVQFEVSGGEAVDLESHGELFRAALASRVEAPAVVVPAVPSVAAAPPATPIRPAIPHPAPPPPAPLVNPHRNWVEVPSVGISVAVGIYSDCTGQTPLTRATAARDVCVPASEVFLVGHRPGVFAALPSMPANAVVNYWDDGGAFHSYRVYQVSRVPSAQGGDVMTNQHPALLMQTCDDPTGSYYYFYGSPV